MADTDRKLSAGYGEDELVDDWIDTVIDYAKDLSAAFEAYGEDNTKGPGLYVAFVSSDAVAEFADQPIANAWYERDEPRYVHDAIRDEEAAEEFYGELEQVANEMDQAVVVWMNGRLHGYNVRFLPPNEELREQVDYEADRGTRHQSAAETAIRDDIVMTLTLSEEDGAVTTFREGEKENGWSRERILEERDA